MDGFVLFCFCPYPGAHWFLSSWRGGRAGVFPRRPVSPSLTSRPAARWPPRAEPRETPGARGTPGVVVHRGPRGLGRWGRRGMERQRPRRKEPNPLGFRGERLPMAQNFPGAEGKGPTRENQYSGGFRLHTIFLWIAPLNCVSRPLATMISGDFPGQVPIL